MEGGLRCVRTRVECWVITSLNDWLTREREQFTTEKGWRNWFSSSLFTASRLLNAIQTLLLLKHCGDITVRGEDKKLWEDKFLSCPSENYFTESSQEASKLVTVILAQRLPQLCSVGLVRQMGLVERKADSTWERISPMHKSVCFNPACSLHRKLVLLLIHRSVCPSRLSVQLRHVGILCYFQKRYWLRTRHWINRVWRHYRSLSFLFQTPAGDARALLPSGGILWWQERCSPW